jgi:hypothetical protein
MGNYNKRMRAENASIRSRKKEGATGNPRNTMDPYKRLSCAVIASAGKEYREIVAAGKKPGYEQQLLAIREWILDPNNIFVNYANYDPCLLLASLDEDLAKGNDTITEE